MDHSDKLIECLNYLQDIPYRINTNFLSYVNKNKEYLIAQELLTDLKYMEINPGKEARTEYLEYIKDLEDNNTDY